MILKDKELSKIQGGAIKGSVIGLISDLWQLGKQMTRYYFAKLTGICIY